PADIVIIDNYLGENNLSGLEIMKIYKSLYPSASFFFYSSDRNITHAKEAIKQGAIDYITKSVKGLQPLVLSVEGFVNTTRAKIEALQNKMPV
ncbi:MAG: response regulator, partial [Bacteroidales bacterium]|nr:response regulator [Bacteroidales bacterium]